MSSFRCTQQRKHVSQITRLAVGGDRAIGHFGVRFVQRAYKHLSCAVCAAASPPSQSSTRPATQHVLLVQPCHMHSGCSIVLMLLLDFSCLLLHSCLPACNFMSPLGLALLLCPACACHSQHRTACAVCMHESLPCLTRQLLRMLSLAAAAREVLRWRSSDGSRGVADSSSTATP